MAHDWLLNWKDAEPGDAVILDAYTQLYSATGPDLFSIGSKIVYSICIARVTNTTIHGVTMQRVYLLTPRGVGFKKTNVSGDRKRKEEAVRNTKVEDWW